MKAMEEIENRILKEEQELEHLHKMSSVWSLKAEVEMNSLFVDIDYMLLK
jgi:hypothetical protein